MKTARWHLLLGWLALFPIIALSGGCSVLEPEDSPPIVTLTNRTGSPLWFQALTSEEATRAYPIPEISLSDISSNPAAQSAWNKTFLEPEASLNISFEQIDGNYQPEDTIVFFLYSVSDSVATYAGLQSFSHEQLKRQQFRVDILSF